MAMNLPTDGMDSLGALIQLQMLDQMRPAIPEQPVMPMQPRPDLPMDTGRTASSPQGIAGVLARYAENRLENKQQPIRMETGGSILDRFFDYGDGQIYGTGNQSVDAFGNTKSSAVADVPEAPAVYGPEDVAIAQMSPTVSNQSSFSITPSTVDDINAVAPSTATAAQAKGLQSFIADITSPMVDVGKTLGVEGKAGKGINAAVSFAMGKLGLGLVNPVQSPLDVFSKAAIMAAPQLAIPVTLGRGLMSVIGMVDAPTVSPSGQTQTYGYGNLNMDMFGNPVGTYGYNANILGYDPEQPEYSKIDFDYVNVPTSDVNYSPDPTPDVESFAQAHGEEVGPGGSGGDAGGADSGSGDQGDTGVGHGAGEGTADAPGWAQGGGISSLAYGGDPAPIGFANQAFEGMVPGNGTGMSDDVPFSIEGQQPALLSRDEYVLPADVVSQLGDGSSGAGADMLDNFVSNVRQNKYGNTNQPPPNGGGLLGSLMKTV